jgi:hypothetical protein
MEDKVIFVIVEKGTNRFRGLFSGKELKDVVHRFLDEDSFTYANLKLEDLKNRDWSPNDLDELDSILYFNGFEVIAYDLEDFVY